MALYGDSSTKFSTFPKIQVACRKDTQQKKTKTFLMISYAKTNKIRPKKMLLYRWKVKKIKENLHRTHENGVKSATVVFTYAMKKKLSFILIGNHLRR